MDLWTKNILIHAQCLIFILAALLVDVSEAIRIQALRMPPHATKGDDVSMECIYDLESDKLYSVKWYRNGHEFYRYIPSDKQKRRIYDRPGINVDRRQSTETSILLRSVNMDTTGRFKCEVSGEAPLFQTASKEEILPVVDLPDEGPVITGGYPRYHIGDKVRVNCTSRRSKPAAKLKWYINGEQADHYHTKHFEIERDEEGLETTTLGLRFKARDKHFKDGDLKLKCTATIANIYWKSNEESVQGVRTQSALVSESRSSRNSPGTADDDEGLYYNLHDPDDPGTPSLEDILMHRGTSDAQPALRAVSWFGHQSLNKATTFAAAHLALLQLVAWRNIL